MTFSAEFTCRAGQGQCRQGIEQEGMQQQDPNLNPPPPHPSLHPLSCFPPLQSVLLSSDQHAPFCWRAHAPTFSAIAEAWHAAHFLMCVRDGHTDGSNVLVGVCGGGGGGALAICHSVTRGEWQIAGLCAGVTHGHTDNEPQPQCQRRWKQPLLNAKRRGRLFCTPNLCTPKMLRFLFREFKDARKP